METGRRGATVRDIRDLCALYDISDPNDQNRMMELARESKEPGWWQSYDLDTFSTYVGLETEAVGLRYYQSSIVPGLLQTADYAKAMIQAWVPKYTHARVAERLEVKLTRQRRLEQDPPLNVWAILDEAALHRVVGGPTVMAEQLDRLAQLSTMPNIKIQVIAYGAGAHVAMGSTFNILDFADPMPSVVYVEGLVGWIYLDRKPDIDRYQNVFQQLLSQALSPQDSGELISEMGTQYKWLSSSR